MATPCYTLHQVNQLWRYAKENYVGKVRPEEMYQQLSDDLGGKLSPEDVARLIAAPKSVRTLSYVAKAKRDAATRSLQYARNYINKLDQSPLQKALDKTVEIGRSAKLTGVTTIEKLGGAGITRIVSTPLEKVAQGVLSRLPGLSKIAERASPQYRGTSLAAETAALRGTVKGIREIPGVLSGRIETYSNTQLPSKILGFPGRIHGAMKRYVSENEVGRTAQMLTDEARKLGKDPNDPNVKAAIADQARAEGNRAIFQNDNALNTAWKGFLSSLERRGSMGGKLTAASARILLPIVKVPMNIAAETGVYTGGLGTGALKAAQLTARAMKLGLDSIKPEEANMVMRHLSKGLVGGGLLLLGYFNPDKFGGLYVRDKKKQGQPALQWGEANFFGQKINRGFLHAPPFTVMQIGATIRKLVDKGTGKPMAAVKTAAAFSEDIPFIREASEIDKMFFGRPDEQRRAVSGVVKGYEPLGLRQIAEYMDNNKKRYPKSFTDELKMGIPYLRQEVSPYKR